MAEAAPRLDRAGDPCTMDAGTRALDRWLMLALLVAAMEPPPACAPSSSPCPAGWSAPHAGNVCGCPRTGHGGNISSTPSTVCARSRPRSSPDERTTAATPHRPDPTASKLALVSGKWPESGVPIVFFCPTMRRPGHHSRKFTHSGHSDDLQRVRKLDRQSNRCFRA